MKTLAFLSASVLLAAGSLLAADQPLLAVPGAVIYENKLDAAPGKEWAAAKGKWEAVDGAWRGSELPEDKHGAVIRLTQKLTDFVIDAEVRFAGAKATSLSINALKDHMARIVITPAAITIQRDDNDHDGPDKAVVFAVFPVKLEPGTWHKVHLEMVGDTLAGQVDDHIAWGSDKLFAQPKIAPGFTAAGQSIEWRNFSIRAATLNPGWESVKATLPKPGALVTKPVAKKPAQ